MHPRSSRSCSCRTPSASTSRRRRWPRSSSPPRSTLFDFEGLRWLWKVRRSELWLSLIALLGVVALGALEGILVAIALALGDFVRRAWRPYDAVLGRIEGTKGYHDIDRHPEALQIPGLVLYRFDAPIFFANAELFSDRLQRAVHDRGDGTRWVIVAAEPITDVDTTGAEILSELLDDLEARGVEVAFAELKGPVKDRLRSYGLYERIGDDRFFPTTRYRDRRLSRGDRDDVGRLERR